MLTRRSCRHRSYWVVVINGTESALHKYHLIKVDCSRTTEDVLRSTFPRCVIQKMPPYMSNILAAINSKSIYCSFCANVLLDHIGNMARIYGYNHLLQMYDSEETFVDHCIEIVVCHYIEKSLYSLDADKDRLLSRQEYFLMLKGCKDHSKIKNRKRRCDEMYLGKSSFPNELLRSFHKLLAVVTHTFVFLPYKFDIIDD